VNVEQATNAAFSQNLVTRTTATTTGGAATGTFAAPASGGPFFYRVRHTNQNLPNVPVQGSTTNNFWQAQSSGTVTVSLLSSDTTPPVITPSVTGTLGMNGWYTSDVSITWSVTDPDSSISSKTGCDAGSVTTDTTGVTLTCSATSTGGTAAQSVTIKRDATGPTATLSATGTMGSNGWYTSNVTVSTTGEDSISSPVTCTPNQVQSTDTTGTAFNGSCTNAAGLTTNAAPLTVKRDATAPLLNPVVSPNPVVLNGTATSAAGASDATSGLASASCDAPDASSVGSKTVACTATDNAGNSATGSGGYSVIYAAAGMCLGAAGHSILDPMSASGPNVVKQKSTVPAKFRVCDANGVSIGTPGVVSGFAAVSGTGVPTPIESTTPHTAFRWSPLDQQWIFNISTKSLAAGQTYVFTIGLNDGSAIPFSLTLR
jgi:hypothetical protein